MPNWGSKPSDYDRWSDARAQWYDDYRWAKAVGRRAAINLQTSQWDGCRVARLDGVSNMAGAQHPRAVIATALTRGGADMQGGPYAKGWRSLIRMGVAIARAQRARRLLAPLP